MPSPAAPSTGPGRPPGGLVVATAAVTAVGLASLGWSAWEGYRLATSTPQNERVAVGTALYFATFGALVLLVAWSFARRRGWAFGAAVFVLLLALAIAAVMVQGGFWVGAVLLGGTALAGLAAALRPDTRVLFGR
ncbi:MAG: hypothetical protein MUC45_01955 [Actinomycetia bacterium]|nr:hypothetical protein [Actinomycetes bacterium]